MDLDRLRAHGSAIRAVRRPDTSRWVRRDRRSGPAAALIPVAMDARRLQDSPLIGAGRWIANVVPQLRGVDLLLVTDGRRPPPDLGLPCLPLAIPRRLPEVVWLHTRVATALRRRPGIFHGTFGALPTGLRMPALLQLNDLSFEIHPEDFSPARRATFALQARLAVRRAAHVLTISEHARASITRTYGVDPSNISVAPPAVDPVFGPRSVADVEAVLSDLGVRRPYVVAVGGARRRGLEVALAAWRALPASLGPVGMVVVGSEAPPALPGVVHAGRVPDRTWAELLAGAEALCYPTRFEGYGMPALEAAASGVPVVCAPVGPLPEVLGDAAEWCDDTSAAAIGAGLRRILGDPDRHAALRAAGLARAAAAPTWADSARIVLAAYRTVAETAGAA